MRICRPAQVVRASLLQFSTLHHRSLSRKVDATKQLIISEFSGVRKIILSPSDPETTTRPLPTPSPIASTGNSNGTNVSATIVDDAPKSGESGKGPTDPAVMSSPGPSQFLSNNSRFQAESNHLEQRIKDHFLMLVNPADHENCNPSDEPTPQRASRLFIEQLTETSRIIQDAEDAIKEPLEKLQRILLVGLSDPKVLLDSPYTATLSVDRFRTSLANIQEIHGVLTQPTNDEHADAWCTNSPPYIYDFPRFRSSELMLEQLLTIKVVALRTKYMHLNMEKIDEFTKKVELLQEKHTEQSGNFVPLLILNALREQIADWGETRRHCSDIEKSVDDLDKAIRDRVQRVGSLKEIIAERLEHLRDSSIVGWGIVVCLCLWILLQIEFMERNEKHLLEEARWLASVPRRGRDPTFV